jgi:hypothetical protein
MASPTNPAGRLHAFLAAYREAAEPGLNIIETWMLVLQVETDRAVIRQLCAIAGLIDQIDRDISSCGDEGQRELFDHHAYAWAQPLLFPNNLGGRSPSSGKELVDINALIALRSISSYFSIAMPLGSIPNDEIILDLRQQIQGAIDSLMDAPELPGDFRKLLLNHLHAIAWALDHIKISGSRRTPSARYKVTNLSRR